MATTSLILNLPQMIDLAVNTPELGLVNFRVLGALLHVLINQLNLTNCNVEYRGKDSEQMKSLLTVAQSSTPLNLSEYVISPQDLAAGKGVNAAKPKAEAKDEDTTVVLVEQKISDRGPHVSVAMSKTTLDKMQSDIKNLQEKFTEIMDLPGNLGILDAVRNPAAEETPIVNMFNMMSQSKRIDAVEGGLEKMASLLEDLARNTQKGRRGSDARRRKETPKSKDGDTKQDETEAQADPKSPTAEQQIENDENKKMQSSKTSLKSLGALYDLEDRILALEEKMDIFGSRQIKDSEYTLPAQNKSEDAVRRKSGNEDEVLLKLRQRVKELGDKVGGLVEITKSFPPQEIVALLNEIKKKSGQDSDSANKVDEGIMFSILESKLNELDGRIEDRNRDMFNMNTAINNQLSMLQSQFTDMEKDMASMLERVNNNLSQGDMSSERGIADLYNKIQEHQTDIELLAEHAHRLAEEKDERQQHLEAIIEQVEVLKTIKADKEDLEDALADKADACAINRKVSHDQFDAACDDLSRSIEEALAKLSQQESLWQGALDDIQREIGNKLDKMELSPLRDFINHKLKTLQDKLKALAALKRETEAAGSKSKYLRDVNCISCDKDVVMRRDIDSSMYPPAPALPTSKNMGPYLAYELDALRKQQKMIPGARNLNHFETATGKKSKQDNLCNRYCGGSHTITTPQQRITRLGHFLQQWGPEALPAGEGQIRGSDGHMYKGEEPPTKDAGDGRSSLQIQGMATPQQAPPQKSGSKLNQVVAEKEATSARERPESKTSVSRSSRVQSAGSVKRKSSARLPSMSDSKSAVKQKSGDALPEDEAQTAAEGNTGASSRKGSKSSAKSGTSLTGSRKGSKGTNKSVVILPETIPEGEEAAAPAAAEGEEAPAPEETAQNPEDNQQQDLAFGENEAPPSPAEEAPAAAEETSIAPQEEAAPAE